MSLLLLESKEARSEFVTALQKMPYNNELLTTAETLLILYDQYTEMIRKNPGLENEFGR